MRVFEWLVLKLMQLFFIFICGVIVGILSNALGGIN